uniref:Uncharacterized protein n=1 Tax=Anguilla anguilla TaxID=7936 RepID=A0A0E9VA52_ANGAN
MHFICSYTKRIVQHRHQWWLVRIVIGGAAHLEQYGRNRNRGENLLAVRILNCF